MNNMPFTAEEFFEVFKQYNLGVWPAQILIYLVAAVILLIRIRPIRNTLRWQAIGLALLWLWTGIVYHWSFFSGINPAAKLFGGVYILEAILMVALTFSGTRFQLASKSDNRSITGWVFVIFAMIIYPVLSPLFGHPWPAMPSFGLPCPLTIFTFGVLLWWGGRQILWLAIIPLLWALVGTTAAFNFGVWQDITLFIAGVAGFVLLFKRRRTVGTAASED